MSGDALDSEVGTVNLFIDGRWKLGSAGTLTRRNPATGEPVADVTLASDDDIDAAVAAALAAQLRWKDRPAADRGAVLVRAAGLLRDRTDQIAANLTAEQGKTLREARVEVLRGADSLTWNGEEAGRLHARYQENETGNGRVLVLEPVGVVAAFTAWNFPVVLICRKLGAALAAGCVVALKAAEETPQTAAAIVEAFDDAGLPSGVVSLVFGDPPRVAERLIRADAVQAVSFTGSTAVGRDLAARCGAELKRDVFELGGHAPAIVCADADIPTAVEVMVAQKYGSAGQSCVAPSRLLIHRTRLEEFQEQFVERSSKLRVGDGVSPDTDMGPLATARRLDAVERLVFAAQEHGGRVLTGARRLPGPGNFFAPTVLDRVPIHARIMNEEPFGPVITLTSFDDETEVVAEANRLPYGLAAYVFTESPETADRLSAKVRAGTIAVNQSASALPDAPLGGRGVSGLGYEGGEQGILAFTELKLVRRTSPTG